MKKTSLILVSLIFWTVSCFASLAPEPAKASKILNFMNKDTGQTSIYWHRGNGAFCLLSISTDSSMDLPIDSISYKTDTLFGKGDKIGIHSYAVYMGTDSFFTVKGLKNNKLYYYSIFEFNGSGKYINYLTNSFGNLNHYSKPFGKLTFNSTQKSPCSANYYTGTGSYVDVDNSFYTDTFAVKYFLSDLTGYFFSSYSSYGIQNFYDPGKICAMYYNRDDSFLCDTLVIDDMEPSYVSASANKSGNLCAGDTVTISLSTALPDSKIKFYELKDSDGGIGGWSSSSNKQYNNTADPWAFRAISNAGCVSGWSSNISFIHWGAPQPRIETLGNDILTVIDDGSKADLFMWQYPVTIQWFEDTIAISNADSVNFHVKHSGNYSVQLTSDLCGDHMSQSTTVTFTGIEVNEPFIGLTVSPNPAKDHLQIKLQSPMHGKTNICITDLLGKIIYNENVELPSGKFKHDIKIGWNDGLYILYLQNASGKTSKKFVLAR